MNNTIIATNAGNNGSALLFDTGSTNVTEENNAIENANQLLANGAPPPTSFTTIDHNVYGGNVEGGTRSLILQAIIHLLSLDGKPFVPVTVTRWQPWERPLRSVAKVFHRLDT